MTATVYRCACGQAVVDHPVCVECAERRLGELVEAAKRVLPREQHDAGDPFDSWHPDVPP